MYFARSARTTVQRQPAGSPQSNAKTQGVAQKASTQLQCTRHENSHPNAAPMGPSRAGGDLATHAYALPPIKAAAAAREPLLETNAGVGPKSWLADADADETPGHSERTCGTCSFVPASPEKSCDASEAPFGTKTDGHGYCAQHQLRRGVSGLQGAGLASNLGNRQIPSLHSPSNLRYAIYSPRNRADLAAY